MIRIRSDIKLWQHQEEMADFMVSHPKTLLLASCGTGKTLAALRYLEQINAYRALVVTVKPALRSVWEEEVERFTTGAQTIVLDKGSSGDKAEHLMREYLSGGSNTLIFVVNYETAKLLPLDQYDWDVVVLDECHKIKSHNSAVSEALTRMLQAVPRKVAMTGTAWHDRPTDVYSQERFLNPVKRGRVWASETFGSWSEFFEGHVIYRMLDHIKIPTGYKNLSNIADKLAPVFLRINRDDVLTLPPVQHIVRHVELSRKHMAAYKELRKELVLSLGGGELTVDNQMVLALRLHQITGGYYQPDERTETVELEDGRAKVEMLQGIADELGNEPFVVFTRFKEDVERVRAALKQLDITSRVLVGGRDEHRAWRQGEGQALVANIQAGNAGINLTRASYAIFYSTGYSNTDYTQAKYRIDRPGQTKPVTFFHIVARGTIDEDIRAVLGDKDERADELLQLTQGGTETDAKELA